VPSAARALRSPPRISTNEREADVLHISGPRNAALFTPDWGNVLSDGPPGSARPFTDVEAFELDHPAQSDDELSQYTVLHSQDGWRASAAEPITHRN
jgi:hypothetical protein